MNTIVIAILASAVVTFAVIKLLLRRSVAGWIVDHPNQRSLHAVPVPRTGGLGLMAGVVSGWTLLYQGWMAPLLLCSMALLLVSLADDIRGIPALWRFMAHFLVIALFIGNSPLAVFAWPMMALLVFAMVWMTNLYNFMDGSDGLAGGMALIGFSAYAIAAWSAGNVMLAGVTLCIAAAAFVFLCFNFNPARIFMGDAGSIPLGFTAAALGLLGWRDADWPLWFPLLVFSPFIVDATVTLVKRLLKGEAIWQAHRSHYYQKLVLMGWSHKQTALAEYVLMIAVAAGAIYQARHPFPGQVWAWLVWAGVYLGIALYIENRWRLHSSR